MRKGAGAIALLAPLALILHAETSFGQDAAPVAGLRGTSSPTTLAQQTGPGFAQAQSGAPQPTNPFAPQPPPAGSDDGAAGDAQAPAGPGAPTLPGTAKPTQPISATDIRPSTRPRFGVPASAVHRQVRKPVYLATSPDRVSRQDQVPPKPGGPVGTPDHPPVDAPVAPPLYTPEQQKLITAHRRELREADPYAPLGLRIGSLYVMPSIEQGVGYDSNPNQISGGKGSVASRTDGEVKLQSDWSSNELTADLRGGYSYFPNVKAADRPDGNGTIDYRLDATKTLNFITELRGSLTTQQPDSVNLPVATASRPLVWGYGASLGTNYTPGYWNFSLRGNVDRSEFEDAKLADGTILSQRDRDMTQYELRARAGYDITPGIKPFIEGRLDTRQYDEKTDDSGFQRSSVGVAALAGTAFEFSRKLTGEVSAGYADRSYDDARLKDLRGPLTEASLAWSATTLTTVTLRGSTQLVETTLPFSAGAIERKVGIEVSHALLRNLTLTGTLDWTRDDFQSNPERDTYLTGGVKAEYKLTRNLTIKASFLRQIETSNVAGRAFNENVYLMGMRLQY